MWCFLVILVLFNTSIIFTQSLPLLLLVSFDGFRHDYPKIHGPLKNFHRLEQRGVHAQKLISTFVTTTFPNHYTIVTGLYEENHGIISNSMFDPETNSVFDSPYIKKNGSWWTHPAIWNVNEQRKGARSGVASWPQVQMDISKSQTFNRSRSFRDIIDQVLLWFNDPNEPINFGAIYYYEPDLTGHRTGPYSKNMTKTVQECDEHLGYLLDQIDNNEKLRKNLHLIVVSDHGMEQINGTDTVLYLEDYLDLTKAKAYGIPSAMNIFVQSPKDIDIIMKNLSLIPHSQVYRRKDIPDRYHYKNHERIGDILLLFEPGYEIVRKPTSGGKNYNYNLIHGNHGYDNEIDSMKGIFYASGPKFKQNFTLNNSSKLYNTDIFGLMCILLDIKSCPPSNGSLEHIQPFLKSTRQKVDIFIHAIALIGFGLFVLIGILWSIISFRNTTFKKELHLNTQEEAVQMN